MVKKGNGDMHQIKLDPEEIKKGMNQINQPHFQNR